MTAVLTECTCGDLLFIQGCSDPTEMLCGTGQGKMHSPVQSYFAKQVHSRHV